MKVNTNFVGGPLEHSDGLMETIEERTKRVPRITRGWTKKRLMTLYYEQCLQSRRKRRSDESQGSSMAMMSGADTKTEDTDVSSRKSEPIQRANVAFSPAVSRSSKNPICGQFTAGKTEMNLISNSISSQEAKCNTGDQIQPRPRAKKTLPLAPRRAICNLYYPAYDATKENLPIPMETLTFLPGTGKKEVKQEPKIVIRNKTAETQTEQNLIDAESQTFLLDEKVAVQTQTERIVVDARSQTIFNEKIVAGTQTERSLTDAGSQTTSSEKRAGETQTERSLTGSTRCIGTDPIEMKVLEQTKTSFVNVSRNCRVTGVKIVYVQEGWLKLVPE